MSRLFKDPFTLWLHAQGIMPGVYQPGGMFGAPPVGWQLSIGQCTVVYRVPEEALHSLIIVLIERAQDRNGLRSPFADLLRFLKLVRRSACGITEIWGQVTAVSWRPKDSLADERIRAFYQHYLDGREVRKEDGSLWIVGSLYGYVTPLATHRRSTLEDGIALHKAGRLAEAKACYKAVLTKNPDSAVALHWLGTAYAQAGRYYEAMECYAAALRLQPGCVEAHNNRGNVLRSLHRLHEALDSFNHAIALKPDYAEAFNNRAIALTDLGRTQDPIALRRKTVSRSLEALTYYQAALASCDEAIRLRPDYANAIKNRGIVLRCLDRYSEALECYDHCLRLCPQDAQALSYRGNVLHELRRHSEAIESYDHALQLRPNHAETWRHRGVALNALRLHDEALASCTRALDLAPNDVDAHWNKAIIQLITGNYEGWQGFEWRWRDSIYARKLRPFTQPLWLGQEDLTGKTLLIHAEGGLGDTLQFCRYAPLVAQRGVRVILEVQPALISLLCEMDGPLEVIARDEPLPAFDYQVPTMSLPLGFKTTLHDIPAQLPYLRAPEELQKKWAQRLGPRTRPRIGLACSGNPSHDDDHNRSIPLQMLAPLFVVDAEFHCVQKVIRETDREAANTLPMQTWEADLHDFADTAALMASLDLIISVDTSVAHLAGALGKPTWVLLPHDPDFRWMYERADTPWYPEVMRLFRQKAPGQWPSVIDTVALTLLTQSLK